jgi:hypothetical protein
MLPLHRHALNPPDCVPFKVCRMGVTLVYCLLLVGACRHSKKLEIA